MSTKAICSAFFKKYLSPTGDTCQAQHARNNPDNTHLAISGWARASTTIANATNKMARNDCFLIQAFTILQLESGVGADRLRIGLYPKLPLQGFYVLLQCGVKAVNPLRVPRSLLLQFGAAEGPIGNYVKFVTFMMCVGLGAV